MKRKEIMERGISLTTGDRNRTYGDPKINLDCQGELWDVYSRYAGEKHPPAHDAAIQHILAKLARIASNDIYHEDNYVDGSTYFAIAGECKYRAVEEGKPPRYTCSCGAVVRDGELVLSPDSWEGLVLGSPPSWECPTCGKVNTL